MRDIFRAVERIARAEATVLVSRARAGPARSSWRGRSTISRRAAQGPSSPSTAARSPSDLIESELFGHEKGRLHRRDRPPHRTLRGRQQGHALPRRDRRARARRAGEAAARAPGADLRARRRRRSSITVDVRIVAATNRDLDGRGRSRPLPRGSLLPHRGRAREAPAAPRPARGHPAARTDLPGADPGSRAGLSAGGTAGATAGATPGGAGAGRAAATPKKLSAAALGALDGYRWPGNVRELENAIEHGLALCDGDTIELKDLPLSVGRSGQAEALREQWRQGERSFDDTVTRFETEILREALESHQWNQTRTANGLGITRRVLKLKMDKLGIESRGGDEAD